MEQKRHSKKRTAIYELLSSTKSHPTAEWIYWQLKPQYPSLSLGTVYSNLAVFQSAGKIISVGVVGGKERFDADTSAHAHFVCRCCNAVIDVADASAPIVPLPGKAESSNVCYFGVCEDCLKIEKSQSTKEKSS
ncbi:MAG: transcriptional repressor [Oscillospiraceae bacterium]|nr:transcriptional repressor [Oscillospiraceae bacterium]